MRRVLCRAWVGVAGLAVLLGTAGSARAGMTLTAGATADGYTLSTFADGFPTTNPNGGIGPLGIAFTATGGVMVTDYPGNVRVFASDADGQHAGGAAFGQYYGFANAVGLASVNGSYYMTRQGIGDLVQVNADGTFNQVIVSGIPSATGIIADPINGHVFVSNVNNAVYDVDVAAKTKRLVTTAQLDGITLSADGKTLYGADNGTGHILGFDTTTGALVFDSGFIAGGVDGSALGTGTLAGNIFVNTNSGTLVEVNLTTLQQTLIGTGGSRGDFVTVDPNGTLLLTQSDSILRLTAPAGGGFSSTPEPGSLTLAALGALGLVGYRLRRRKAAETA